MPKFSHGQGHRFGGERGHHGWRHHKKHHCCPLKVLLIFLFAAHFYFMKKYQHALEDFEAAGGKLQPKWCKWAKKCEKKREQVQPAPQRQNQVFTYSIVDHDKVFPEVTAPQPQVQTYTVDNSMQQMV